ncbi:MAG: hypothetical protein ABSB69_13225 [Solirubrobacteraceae bacterium]
MRIARLESRPIAVRSATLTALTTLLATALLAIAQPASANVGETIVLRCTHNESLSGFSQSAYRQALKELSADTEEYSDCSSRIHEAALAAASGTRGGAGRSGTTPVAVAATPAERRAITHAEHARPAPVRLSGGIIHPGVVHVDVASALSSLPTPLLVTLAFLLVCLLLVLGGALRKRVRARGSD